MIAAMLLTTVVTGLIFFALGYFRLSGLIRFIAAAFHKFIARRLATRLADTTRVPREVLE